MNSDDYSDICTKDLISMSFLKTKYWGIFRDIEINRDLYTQIRLDDRRAALLFDDKQEKEYREKHFKELFKRLDYTSSDVEVVRSILDKTFPSWNGGPGVNEDSLRLNNRIAHRDLLDMYFSYGISQRNFKQHMQHIRPIVERVSKDSEKVQIRKFKQFNSYALGEESPADVARILAREILRVQEKKSASVIVWRSWLRALLQYEKSTNEATNSILASILSGANETILNIAPTNPDVAQTIDNRVDVSMIFFENVDQYLNETYLALLMLLFLLPERGNAFFLDYTNRVGFELLYSPVLNYVDNHYIEGKRNIFSEYDWPYWSFVLYQWSLSISQGATHINQHVPEASQRHRKVNDYVFTILDKDPKMTYSFIRNQFWSNEGWNSEGFSWRIESKIGQYANQEDHKNILSVTNKAVESDALSNLQKSELREFKRVFEEYLKKPKQDTIAK